MTTLWPGLQSENLLIRVGVGSLVVFGSLYVLDSFGVPGMFGIALLVLAGVFLANQAKTTAAAQEAAPLIRITRSDRV